MIPKIQAPARVKDFRPISVINLIPKLISKILANRLRLKLPDLISPCQTAFIRGRQITDNFVATREVLQHIHKSKNPAVFLKIDFAKAFDSIEWDFLLSVLKARGFSDKWLSWVRELLLTASSRIVLNGENSEFFQHKRGLRQGDPLSPMLFNLAADVFQQMVQGINRHLPNGISRRVKESILAFQYADDTAVIASADITTLISLKLIIRIFASISGLKVNFEKSTFVPLNVPETDKDWVQSILGCKETNFPVSYLGLPLTLIKPKRQSFLTLVERVERQLGGWKGKFLSRGGRL